MKSTNATVRKILQTAALEFQKKHGLVQVYNEGFVNEIVEQTVRECIKVLQQEWYDLNNEPRPENETPRSVAMRVGRKGGIIVLIGKIKKHFGIE